jgi:GxxExxY protein
MDGELNRVTGDIIDASLMIHRELGPGLLESVYAAVLAAELRRRGRRVERQKKVSFTFNGMTFDDGLRIDLLVSNIVVVELKSVESLVAVHRKQVMTYLRLMQLPVGLLINFGGATLKEGLHRIINNHYPLPISPPGHRASG